MAMVRARLFFLLTIVLIGMLIIALRLTQLQAFESSHWRDKSRSFAYRHYIIPTMRGPIVDRFGRILAVDEPCYNLAINYQAMNRDRQWITDTALRRLEKQYHTRSAIVGHLSGERHKILARLNRMPQRIAALCKLPVSAVLSAFDTIRARMQILRQDVWVYRYRQSHRHFSGSPADLDMQLAQANSLDLAEDREAHTIVPDISRTVAFYVAKHARHFPGIVVKSSTHRVYPFNSISAQIIGSMQPVTAAAVKADPFRLPHFIPGSLRDSRGNLSGYLPGDLMGGSGVEAACEKQLRGSRGVGVVDLDGKPLALDHRNPVPGSRVTLTIDADLEKQLVGQIMNPAHPMLLINGHMHPMALVAMSIRTNRVLVMLSLPSYNLNGFHQHYAKILRQPHHPLLDRADEGVFPPGSIVKPLEASYALTHQVITPQTIIDCRGYLFPGHPNIFRCWAYPYGHGPIDVVHAIEESCDVYFYTVGMRLGFDRVVHVYRDYGLGLPTGIGLPDESAGMLPTARPGKQTQTQYIDSIFMGIGQGPMAVTPLQMANAYTAMLRGGVWMPPIIIRGVPHPRSRRFYLNPSALSAVRQGMYLVTHGARGTAPVMGGSGLDASGKTGTAQTSEQKIINGKTTVVKGDDGWFVGFAPSGDPRYVVVGMVEMGGEGGATAAPIVRQCMLDMQARGYLPRMNH
jgi:penicillin-binding protein 2